jgi:glycosyltransferase involved in cell wall biosynthesis
LLVEPENTVKLAEAIFRVLESPTLSSKLSGRARYIVENNYSWAAVTEKLITVYKNII